SGYFRGVAGFYYLYIATRYLSPVLSSYSCFFYSHAVGNKVGQVQHRYPADRPLYWRAHACQRFNAIHATLYGRKIQLDGRFDPKWDFSTGLFLMLRLVVDGGIAPTSFEI